MIESIIKTEKTGRFYLSKTPDERVKNLFFLIHGYGQLASDFIKDFPFWNNDDNLLIAPEGLSKFYTKGVPGASWMTKEDRENEINDYLNFLDGVMALVNDKLPFPPERINILGFSQGVHTAVRYVIHTYLKIDNLILCSSDFPKDADFGKLKKKVDEGMKLFYIYGTKDKAIRLENFENSEELLREKEIKFERVIFDGGHITDEITLISLKLF
ncbi:MAG TPA: hypothetical protein DEP28_08755 [Bacteroidetes bacterium]|nr:hypothetical protein [Bacteroidota bacterium]HCN38015.1 hypothetical protein [Bacteroidota bacterium]